MSTIKARLRKKLEQRAEAQQEDQPKPTILLFDDLATPAIRRTQHLVTAQKAKQRVPEPSFAIYCIPVSRMAEISDVFLKSDTIKYPDETTMFKGMGKVINLILNPKEHYSCVILYVGTPELYEQALEILREVHAMKMAFYRIFGRTVPWINLQEIDTDKDTEMNYDALIGRNVRTLHIFTPRSPLSLKELRREMDHKLTRLTVRALEMNKLLIKINDDIEEAKKYKL